MFADHTNLFYSVKDIHWLFHTVINELSNISHWFNSNKPFLNTDKTKFIVFHKVRQKNNILLVLTTLKINNTLMKGVGHIKFLGVLFDGNLHGKMIQMLLRAKYPKA